MTDGQNHLLNNVLMYKESLANSCRIEPDEILSNQFKKIGKNTWPYPLDKDISIIMRLSQQ